MQKGHHIISVFTRLRSRLLSVARDVVGNDDDADDVLQDAFVKLWLRQDAFVDIRQAELFSVATVRNLSIDRVRHRQVRRFVAIEDDVAVDGGDEQYLQTFDEVNSIVQHELTDVQRAIVEMRELQGAEYEDIARELSMKPAAVRMQLSRARKRVREIYRQKNEHHENE